MSQLKPIPGQVGLSPDRRLWGPFKQRHDVRCARCNYPMEGLHTPTHLGPLKCPVCNSKEFVRADQ